MHEALQNLVSRSQTGYARLCKTGGVIPSSLAIANTIQRPVTLSYSSKLTVCSYILVLRLKSGSSLTWLDPLRADAY